VAGHGSGAGVDVEAEAGKREREVEVEKGDVGVVSCATSVTCVEDGVERRVGRGGKEGDLFAR
jgi:hypothetical protein